MKRNPLGIPLVITGIIFLVTETQYFGNNLFPLSNAEVICDGIGLLVIAIGVALGGSRK